MLAALSRHRSSRPDGSGAQDSGAVAVEFALVLPLLMMFLFGIIQYGYGLFQLQALTAAVGEATQKATTGVTDCEGFSNTLKALVDGNGLDGDSVTRVRLQWLTESGGAAPRPDPRGLVRVTATFTPFKIGIPFVPFPDTITRSQTGTMQNIVSLDLTGCDVVP